MRTRVLAISVLLFGFGLGLPQVAHAGCISAMFGNCESSIGSDLRRALGILHNTIDERWDDIVDEVIDEPLSSQQLAHMKSLVLQEIARIQASPLEENFRHNRYALRVAAIVFYTRTTYLQRSKGARFRMAHDFFRNFWEKYRHFVPRANPPGNQGH